MQKHRLKMLFTSLLMALSVVPVAQAAPFLGSQFHMRLGLLSSSFYGPTTGSNWVPYTFDLEYEIFSSNRSSYTIRSILSFDISTSRMAYAFTGLGRRYYLNSSGLRYEQESGISGDRVTTIPRFRTYVGAKLGVSQVRVKDFGPALQIPSTLFDLGPDLGAIYQITPSLGVEMNAGASLGLGFSSVSVTGISYYLFLGGSYFF
ncbi:MAG: hypothetical protein ACO3A2_03410 [Bdellovibrionia bacterium]